MSSVLIASRRFFSEPSDSSRSKKQKASATISLAESSLDLGAERMVFQEIIGAYALKAMRINAAAAQDKGARYKGFDDWELADQEWRDTNLQSLKKRALELKVSKKELSQAINEALEAAIRILGDQTGQP